MPNKLSDFEWLWVGVWGNNKLTTVNVWLITFMKTIIISVSDGKKLLPCIYKIAGEILRQNQILLQPHSNQWLRRRWYHSDTAEIFLLVNA